LSSSWLSSLDRSSLSSDSELNTSIKLNPANLCGKYPQQDNRDVPVGVNVGYLPAITAPPTQMKVILSIMNRTVQYKKELELDYIFLEVPDQANI